MVHFPDSNAVVGHKKTNVRTQKTAARQYSIRRLRVRSAAPELGSEMYSRGDWGGPAQSNLQELVSFLVIY